MDINTLRGISTILVMIAFFGVCWWAFSPRRKQRFEEAANLPFADAEVRENGSEPRRDRSPGSERADRESGNSGLRRN